VECCGETCASGGNLSSAKPSDARQPCGVQDIISYDILHTAHEVEGQCSVNLLGIGQT